MPSNKYIKEVEETLSRLSNKKAGDTSRLQGYLGTGLSVLGLSAPVQKQVCRQGFSFYHDDKEQVLKVFDGVYKGGRSHEAKNQAFLFLDLHYKHISPALQLELLPSWVEHVDNWAHSDYLSKFLTRLLEHEGTGKAMMATLKRWNSSTNPWERRQSLVSLFYYARTKKTHVPFDTCVRFIKSLLGDPDYYVQKAVGWTLRECYNVYPQQAFEFMLKHYRQISAIAFTAAIEKMSVKEKNELKTLRRTRA